MPIIENIGVNGDEISIMKGFNGYEPTNVLKWCLHFIHEYQSRFVISFNLYYPDFKSNYYFNRRLLAFVQESFLAEGLYVIIEDNYSCIDKVPSELPGSLELGDDYLLVSKDLKLVGRIYLWTSLGGNNSFYHDNILLDVITEHGLDEKIICSVKKSCEKRCIAISYTDGHYREVPSKKIWPFRCCRGKGR